MPIIIKNFSEYYETSDNRKVKEMKWLALPIKFDGLKYRRIMKMKDGLEIMGVWIILLQLSAKMPVRGTLATKEGDLTLEDIQLMTDCPLKSLEKAIPVLSSEAIGWIQNSSDNLPKISDNPRTTLHNTTLQDITEQDTTKLIDFDFEILKNTAFLKAWTDWKKYRTQKKSKLTSMTEKKQLSMLEKHGALKAVEIINQSIQNGWLGLFEPKKGAQNVSYADRQWAAHEQVLREAGLNPEVAAFHSNDGKSIGSLPPPNEQAGT